jgi:hypothetical protein
LGRPVKENAPAVFAVLEAFVVPLRVMVTLPTPLIVPEIVKVWPVDEEPEALKLAVWFAPLIVTGMLAGEKV